MNQDLGQNYSSINKDNLKVPMRKTYNEGMTNKCYQCNYSYSYPSNLKRHLKIHSGEKPNKCNQCNFASVGADDLRTHLKTHNGEKPNKCNQ